MCGMCVDECVRVCGVCVCGGFVVMCVSVGWCVYVWRVLGVCVWGLLWRLCVVCDGCVCGGVCV